VTTPPALPTTIKQTGESCADISTNKSFTSAFEVQTSHAGERDQHYRVDLLKMRLKRAPTEQVCPAKGL